MAPETTIGPTSGSKTETPAKLGRQAPLTSGAFILHENDIQLTHVHWEAFVEQPGG